MKGHLPSELTCFTSNDFSSLDCVCLHQAGPQRESPCSGRKHESLESEGGPESAPAPEGPVFGEPGHEGRGSETGWSRFSEARTSDDNDLGSGQDLASSGMTKALKLKRDYHHGNVR